MLRLAIVVLFFYFLNCFGQVVKKGKCANIQNMPGLDGTRFFAGRWLKYQNFFFSPEFTQKCCSFRFTPRSDGNFDELISGIDVNTGKVVKIPRVEVVSEEYTSLYTYEGLTPDNFYIPETDYTSYAVIYTCKENKGLIAELVYITTRNPNPLPKDLLDGIYSRLAKTGVDPGNFITADQSNCPSYELIDSAPAGSTLITNALTRPLVIDSVHPGQVSKQGSSIVHTSLPMMSNTFLLPRKHIVQPAVHFITPTTPLNNILFSPSVSFGGEHLHNSY